MKKLLLLACAIGGTCMSAAGADVHVWGCFEAAFQGRGDGGDPVQDVHLEVEFASPGGARRVARGFWDGGRTWRVRFMPTEAGRWTWRSRSAEDPALDGQTGSFDCAPYAGANPLYCHGPIRLAANRRHLAHADGTPWFWLSDTVWNGALLASKGDWATYLEDRADKGFTAIQFVTTQWRAATGDADGRAAYAGKERIAIHPEFYQRLDGYLDALNARGLVAAPVLLWAVGHALDPGSTLPEDQAVVLASYMVARYGAHHCIYFLGGDGNYGGEKAERWRRIGRAVFGDRHHQLATMHFNGQGWYAAEFRAEPWYAFHGYQSGHGDGEKHLRWLIEGPPAAQWDAEPVLPLINLEPNYEGHRGYQHKSVFTDYEVRRAAYWSLLIAPTAGVSYGSHGIWPWMRERGTPLNHAGAGEAPPWHEAMRLPGSMCMKHVRACFDAVEWWRLRPAPDMLAEQPGKADPRKFAAAARADDGSFAVVYLPTGGSATVKTGSLKAPLAARWFDPRAGAWKAGGAVASPAAALSAPDGQDWVLWIGRAAKR